MVLCAATFGNRTLKKSRSAAYQVSFEEESADAIMTIGHYQTFSHSRSTPTVRSVDQCTCQSPPHRLSHSHVDNNTERMMRARDVLPPFEASYSVDEFCLAERMSRVSLYAMWKQGKGPRFY